VLPDVPTYPGHRPADRAYLEAVRPFGPEDEETQWVLDFHAPGGLTPLALAVLDAAVFGSQAAADSAPVAGSLGLRARLAGSHPYVASAAVVSPDDRDARAARSAARLEGVLAGFPAAWGAAAAELELRYERFEARERRTDGLPAARALLGDALALLRRAWAIHFEFMYPLVEGYVALLELARELGLDPRLVPQLLQGYPTRITEVDAAVWRVAATVAREGAADDLEVDAVRRRFGDRNDEVYEVSRPSWRDDAAPIVERATRLAPRAAEGTLEEKLRASAAARRGAEADALSELGPSGRAAFTAALERARRANFVWWNEEHNAYIDLRAHIPLGRAARRLATELRFADRELVFFLFLGELEQLAGGRGDLAASLALAGERAALYERWKAMRRELPTIVGRAPEQHADPIMQEIFGITGEDLGQMDDGGEPTVLHGMAVAPGRATGRARVVTAPEALAAVETGDILVCEATTPAWTHVFARIAGCICNVGGSLTHAAIVSREYGVPCVTAVPDATAAIPTGALVEVDGSEGVVVIGAG
jgi:phosphohistidine swiveling domain-containing protein